MECPVCHTENDVSALQYSSPHFVLGDRSPRRTASTTQLKLPLFGMEFPGFSGSCRCRRRIGRCRHGFWSRDGGSDFGPRYRVEGKLGERWMGSVYKAYDPELDRLVALKVIGSELMANALIPPSK